MELTFRKYWGPKPRARNARQRTNWNLVQLCVVLRNHPTNALYMLTSHYSHCYIATCFGSLVAILREYWYIFWVVSTKRVSRRKYQIKEQRPVWYVAVVKLCGVNEVMLTHTHTHTHTTHTFTHTHAFTHTTHTHIHTRHTHTPHTPHTHTPHTHTTHHTHTHHTPHTHTPHTRTHTTHTTHHTHTHIHTPHTTHTQHTHTHTHTHIYIYI